MLGKRALPRSPSASDRGGGSRPKTRHVTFSDSTASYERTCHESYERAVGRSRTPATQLMRLRARAEFRRYTIREISDSIDACEAECKALLAAGKEDEASRTALADLRGRIKELEQDKDVQEFKLLNIENDVFVLMRAHREEIEAAFTDSGTDSGVSSGSEDGSPRFADLEGAPAASEHPFGRAEDVAGGDAERISEGGTASAASGGGGSSSVSIATTELATDSIRSGRLEGGALAAALAAAVPREPALIRESCSGALAELLAGVSTSLRLPLVAAPRWERSLGESDGDSDHVGTPHAFTPEPPNVRCSPRTGQRAEDAAPAPWRNLAATPEAG